MRLTSLKMLSVALVGLALSMSQATAATIVPGGSAMPTADPAFPNVPIDRTLVATITPTLIQTAGPGNLVVELTSWVYAETAAPVAGNLTFAWQAKVVSGSGSLSALSVSDFSLAAPQGDVGYVAVGGKNANMVQWSPDAVTLQWAFDQVLAGQLSPVMFFKSKNKSYAIGEALAQGSGQYGGPTFQPVPEPGALALAFAALPVLGLYGLRRRARA